jgi:phosphonate transport system permease protein
VSDAPADIRGAFLARRTELEAAYPGMLGAGWPARARTIALVGGVLAVYVAGLHVLEFSPAVIAHGLWRLADIAGLMLPPSPGSWTRFLLYLNALGQTLSIALLGTLTAAVLAVPLGFLAARNVMTNRLLHALTRRSLDTIRSIDTLIWALIWINVVGLGPFAGALAIASADVAAFAKLMSESIEAADHRPGEGVAAAGGGHLARVRFGILPQVLPIFASQVLYFFESNTRSATIIGVVGAGGIGLWLSEAIRVLEWQETSFLILMVLVTVAAIDAVSRRLRAAIIGRHG